MTDLSQTIIPKSDQLNADDFDTGPKTITITRVSPHNGDNQPINVFYEGDNGKPYRPCKSMRRVMVHAWGIDGNAYAGRSMTLYRDPEVTFGANKTGGIRISHMSHIDRDMSIILTSSKTRRAPYQLKVLRVTQPNTSNQSKPDQEIKHSPPSDDWPKFLSDMEYAITNAPSQDDLDLIMRNSGRAIKRLQEADAEAFNRLRAMTVARREEIKAEMEQDQ
jgi:hypothetical protein